MPDPITYHPLTAETAPLLSDSDVFDTAVDPEQLAAFVAAPGHLLIFARQGARVLGFASCTVLLHPDKAPTLFVNEVGVACDMRRQGIATTLCHRLFNEARALGAESMWLATEADNAPARGLYRALKARETCGIVMYEWDGATDA